MSSPHNTNGVEEVKPFYSDEMLDKVAAWFEANPAPLPSPVRETLSDCAEFLADIDGNLARRCEAALLGSSTRPEAVTDELIEALKRVEHEGQQSADTYGCANCNCHAEIARDALSKVSPLIVGPK